VPTELGLSTQVRGQDPRRLRLQGRIHRHERRSVPRGTRRLVQDFAGSLSLVYGAVPGQLRDVLPTRRLECHRLHVQAWLPGAKRRAVPSLPDRVVQGGVGQRGMRVHLSPQLRNLRMRRAGKQHGVYVVLPVRVQGGFHRHQLRCWLAPAARRQDMRALRADRRRTHQARLGPPIPLLRSKTAPGLHRRFRG